MDPILLDLTEAAALLSFTPGYLKRNYKDLGLPVVKTGHRTIRFRRADLEKWAAKNARLR